MSKSGQVPTKIRASAPFNVSATAEADSEKSRPKAKPFSLRLSHEERAILNARAKGRPLGEYIRRQLFGDDASARRVQRQPKLDDVVIAKALAGLGGSQLAASMKAIADSASYGALPVTDELLDELREACADIRNMRFALIKALGIKPLGDVSNQAFSKRGGHTS